MSSGIYQIRNLINNKIYIGSGVDYKSRFRVHRCTLNKGTHRNIHLQNAWNKYGGKNFEFSLLINCHKDNLLFYEQQFIDQLKPEYNILQVAGRPIGHKVPYHIRVKISTANKGRKHTPEAKKKIAAAGIGRKQPTKVYEGFISPEGIEYRNILGLKRFCQQYGLNYSNMNQVDNGHKRIHKGWRRLHASPS